MDFCSVRVVPTHGEVVDSDRLQSSLRELDLSPVGAGRYEMICLPVKLHRSDGAPARAILRPIFSGDGSHNFASNQESI